MYQRWWNKCDWLLVALTLVLMAIGLMVIDSAKGHGQMIPDEFKKQLIYCVAGFLFLALFAAIDYGFWGKHDWTLYAVNLIMLALVLVIGKESKGAQRWLHFGPVDVQPSELAKLLFILTLARFFAKRPNPSDPKTVALALAYLAAPMLLIVLQPDLGTSLVFLAIFFFMAFVAGMHPLYLGGFCAAGAAMVPVLFHFLKEYQKKRLTVFLHPEADPQGDGYHLIQSKIAIGSGQLWGKGLFQGTQGALKFVPESHTDFIFTVVGEEMGLVGGAAILCLYLIVFLRGIGIARMARDPYGTLVATGIVTMLFFHVFVNVGMTIGIMPITGIPLPFLSYGGSSLITNLAAIGILLSINIRQAEPYDREHLAHP